MCVVTIVHWSLFIHANVAFKLWAALYFVTPFMVAAVWWLNRREETGRPDEPDAVISARLRRIGGYLGAIGLVVAIVFLLVPRALIAVWAWPLTPLTARVLCVIFVLFNVYVVGLARDPRWSAARVIVESLAVALLLILVGVLRTRHTFFWSRPSAWLFLLGTVAALVVSVWSWMTVGRRT
jgi:hypothetical protein